MSTETKSPTGGEDMGEKLLTAKDLALILQVSEKWVYKAVDNKLIPFYRVGRFVRFRRHEIERWLDTSAVPVGGPR